MSSAHPPLLVMAFNAYGPSAGLPIASERAIVFGRCGAISLLYCLIAVEMGEHPEACAPKNFTGFGSTSPSRISSSNAFLILVINDPPAIGTTTLSGKHQPSC